MHSGSTQRVVERCEGSAWRSEGDAGRGKPGCWRQGRCPSTLTARCAARAFEQGRWMNKCGVNLWWGRYAGITWGFGNLGLVMFAERNS
jgi:hypothetical protein